LSVKKELVALISAKIQVAQGERGRDRKRGRGGRQGRRERGRVWDCSLVVVPFSNAQVITALLLQRFAVKKSQRFAV
jgi:hypothetical protein